MQSKIKIEGNNSVYEINATLIADHKAKIQSKSHMDPMITAYSIVYGEIFDEALASPQILEAWVRTSMKWENIKENAKLVSGPKQDLTNWKDIRVSFVAKQVVK